MTLEPSRVLSGSESVQQVDHRELDTVANGSAHHGSKGTRPHEPGHASSKRARRFHELDSEGDAATTSSNSTATRAARWQSSCRAPAAIGCLVFIPFACAACVLIAKSLSGSEHALPGLGAGHIVERSRTTWTMPLAPVPSMPPPSLPPPPSPLLPRVPPSLAGPSLPPPQSPSLTPPPPLLPPSPPPPPQPLPLPPPLLPSAPSLSPPQPPPYVLPPMQPPPVPSMCIHRHVLARTFATSCQRYTDGDGYAIVHDCVFVSRCDRGNPNDYASMCGDHLLPAADSFTAFFQCNNDCSVGPRLECPVRHEDGMLRRAGVSSIEWDDYVARLYGAAPSEHPMLPRLSQIDMVYTRMRSIAAIEPTNYDNCPRNANSRPIALEKPHVRAAAYYALGAPALPAANHSWAEVTHCSSHIEDQSLWFFMTRGSAIFVNVGRTITFREHQDAALFFGVFGDISNVPAAAAAAGYDSIQYTEHCEGCRCDHELLFTRARGEGACPQGVTFRTGVNASRACTCQAAQIGWPGQSSCTVCSSFADMV